jgi:hypothetical protein
MTYLKFIFTFLAQRNVWHSLGFSIKDKKCILLSKFCMKEKKFHLIIIIMKTGKEMFLFVVTGYCNKGDYSLSQAK